MIRNTAPRAFRRNFRFESVGTVKAEVIERYVRGQVAHHLPEMTPEVRQLADLQIECDADLMRVRYSAHGQFVYNLHLVFCRTSESPVVDVGVIERIRMMLRRVCEARGFILSCVGVLPDHLHLVAGCPWDLSPLDAALCFLNNLAFVEGMTPVYRFGFYAGTCGAYDLGAVRRHVGAG